MKERLQKILSRAGYGSRRVCEILIASGRVTINKNQASLGDKADVNLDEICLDGEIIKGRNIENIYIAFNKPKDVLSDIYPKANEKTIRDFIPINQYYFIVGRLDKESEGLLILSNDGQLANQLTHPRYEHEKEYHVLVGKKPDIKQINIWRKGVVLDNGYHTLPARIKINKKSHDGYWITVIMKEGKKRQIREVGAMLGLPVLRIVRTRIANLWLGNLKAGSWKFIDRCELDLK